MLSLHIDTARTWRGGQNQALLTVLGLRAIGHRTFLMAHPQGELRRRASEGPDLIPFAPRAELDLTAAWRMTRIIRDVRPTIIHAHDPHGVAVAALALSYQTYDPHPILVASRRVDFRLRTNAFSPAPPLSVHEAYWLPHNAPLAGAVGALVGHKGHRYLIEAAAQVVREVPDARFVILGEGDLRGPLEKLIAELHLEKHVILGGFRPDVLSLLKGFDFFVMPSVTEGLGTSLLDAMACAKPIVASRVGGIPEVVVDGKTGILVPPKDSHRLADAIVRMMQDRAAAAAMGNAGYTRVTERFTVERMVEETLAVYERLDGSARATDRRNRAADA
jgi:L-malate glycosyltransferase